MPGSATRLAVACALFIGCAGFAGAQVGPVRDQPQPAPPPTGTGRITGQVVAADTGAPIKHVQVTLTGSAIVARPSAAANGQAGGSAPPGAVAGGIPGTPPSVAMSGSTIMSGAVPTGMVRTQAETDETGRFDFTELPAGQFALTVVSPPGFVRPERPENVRLADGQSSAITLRVSKGGAITGRVLDETGDALAGVNVSVLRRDATTGGRLLPSGGGGYGQTDDLGHFRIWGLPAGEYYVAATYNRSQGIYMSGPGTSPPAPHAGYGPTYYPGSSALESARKVVVRAGQDTPGVEFALQRVMLARITGTATDSNGASLTVARSTVDSSGRTVTTTTGPSGSVVISSRDVPYSFTRGASVRPDGTFEITDVAPGDYELVARVTRGQPPDQQEEAASVPVSVNGSDVSVNIQTNTGATLSGCVIVEGGDAAQATAPAGSAARPPQITVSVRPDPTQSFIVGSNPRPAQVGDDGSFELKGVRGPVIVTAGGGRGVLKSVSRGGQDVTAKTMTFQGTERVNDLQIVVTTETGTLQGVVTDSRGEPAAGVRVIIFPDNPDRWFSGWPFISGAMSLSVVPPVTASAMSAAPGQPTNEWTPVVGGFRAQRLLPGRYWVAALPDVMPMLQMDRESLEKLRATATSVTVTTGEPATVTLHVK